MVGVGGGGGFEIAHVKSGFQILKERRGVPLDGCVAGLGLGGGVPERGGALVIGGGEFAVGEVRERGMQELGLGVMLDQPQRELGSLGAVLGTGGTVRTPVVGHELEAGGVVVRVGGESLFEAGDAGGLEVEDATKGLGVPGTEHEGRDCWATDKRNGASAATSAKKTPMNSVWHRQAWRPALRVYCV